MSATDLIPCRHCGRQPELFKLQGGAETFYRYSCVTEHTPFLFCPAWMRWAPLMPTLEAAARWWNVENSKAEP